jgi:thiosulfate dehydrogenase [quinone] large subunit
MSPTRRFGLVSSNDAQVRGAAAQTQPGADHTHDVADQAELASRRQARHPAASPPGSTSPTTRPNGPWVAGHLAHAQDRQPAETPGQRTEREEAIMAIQQETARLDGTPRPSAERELAAGTVITTGAARFLAVFRVVIGFEFLWAFLDKTFGFGYATPAARAWINGGSPTKGFLSRVAVGPFESILHSWAGAAWADWLFMAGLLGIGIALILGIGLRAAAVSGTLMMVLMWAAEWPLDKLTSAGEPSMSTNPIVDYHIIYALALIALALTYAGHTWGLGRLWARLPFVQRNPWLL